MPSATTTVLPLDRAARKPLQARVTPVSAPDFGHALGQLEAGHWPQAFAELSALADAGHAPAARIALTLLGRGGLLFGGHFHATPHDVARWQRHAG